MFGLSFLTGKLIIIGVVVIAILSYIGFLKIEVAHYKHEYEQVQLAFDEYRTHTEGMQKALISRAEALTLQVKETLINQWKADDAKQIAIRNKLRAEAIARTIVVPQSIIGVLNSSATAGRDSSNPSPTFHPDAPSSSGTTGGGVCTLADVAETVIQNNSEHWKCIEQVRSWQGFWKSFESSVSAVAKESGG